MSKKCRNCGYEMADNMNFCPQCHAKYEAATVQSPSVPVQSVSSDAAGDDFSEVAKVVIAARGGRFVVEPSPSGQLKLFSAGLGTERFDITGSLLCWVFPLIFVWDMFLWEDTVELDAAGDPAGIKGRLRFKSPCSSFSSSVATIFWFFFVCCTAGIGFIFSWLFRLHRKTLARRALKNAKNYIPMRGEIIPPRHSSFDFKGKTAAEIAEELFRGVAVPQGITVFSTRSAADVLGGVKGLTDHVSFDECIFSVELFKDLFGTPTYIVFTTRGLFCCSAKKKGPGLAVTNLNGLVSLPPVVPYRDVKGMIKDLKKLVFCTERAYCFWQFVKTPLDEFSGMRLLDFVRGMQERDN